MKNFIFILIGIILVACGSTKSKTRIETKPKLPPIVVCAKNAKIYDRDSEFERNELKTLDDLSFSTTYTLLYTPTDSLEKNKVRFNLAKASERVFKKVFPNGKSVDASSLLNKEFSEIARPAANFYTKGKDISEGVKKLTVPASDSKQQLFVNMRSYLKDGQFSNNIFFYVFDTKNNELKYYDYIVYKCDPRDETMFMKTLYYGLNKLKNSIK